MRLYNQLSVLYIQYTKIYFQLNNTNSPPKLAWIYLKNHAVLRHCVFVDGCGYTFTLDGQKSWWGATGSGGRTAKCAANEDETWLWPWQYHLSDVFLGSCWSNEYCVGFFFSNTGEEKMDPHKSVVFRYDGMPAHRPIRTQLMLPPLDIVKKDLSCLKATPKADISSPEIKRCITGMRAKP